MPGRISACTQLSRPVPRGAVTPPSGGRLAIPWLLLPEARDAKDCPLRRMRLPYRVPPAGRMTGGAHTTDSREDEAWIDDPLTRRADRAPRSRIARDLV